MARRRLQKHGDLRRIGKLWRLRWREDFVDENGKKTRGWSRFHDVGFCSGVGALTRKQAERSGWDLYLSRVDAFNRSPSSILTVAEFVERKFVPEHVAMLKLAGQIHYRAMLKHIVRPDDTRRAWPYIGELRLRDVTTDEAQRLVSAVLAAGYSVQTARHVRNVISAVFSHAKSRSAYTGDNPAALVKLPEMRRKPAHALTFEQAKGLVGTLCYPAREMALFAILTSMNVAEICGLTWQYVNLLERWAMAGCEAISPRSLLVRQQWYRGQYGTVKQSARRRSLPIPAALLPILTSLSLRPQWTGPSDPVLAARNGHPVDEHNVLARKLKPAGTALGMPWISWHVFRRTHTTLAQQLGMAFQDRMAMMGHDDARMTMLYTVEDLDRRRTILDQMATRLIQ